MYACVPVVYPFGSTVVCVCVCVCYYIAAAIAVAATATIVATAASHAPPPPPQPHPPSVLCPSAHPVPSTHPKLEGEKSDPLQSKAQVLRQTSVSVCVFISTEDKRRPVIDLVCCVYLQLHTELGGEAAAGETVPTLWLLTVRTCFKPAFLSSFSSFFLLFSGLVLSAQS